MGCIAPVTNLQGIQSDRTGFDRRYEGLIAPEQATEFVL